MNAEGRQIAVMTITHIQGGAMIRMLAYYDSINQSLLNKMKDEKDIDLKELYLVKYNLNMDRIREILNGTIKI